MQRPHGLTLRTKSKVPPVASAGPLSGQNPAPHTYLTPAKPTPPRPKGPEPPRFKRDVVTRNQSRCSLSRGKLTVHARKRLTALTRRYSPSTASGLDGLTPTAHVTTRRGGSRVWLCRVRDGTGRTFQTAAAYAGHGARRLSLPVWLQLAPPCRDAASVSSAGQRALFLLSKLVSGICFQKQISEAIKWTRCFYPARIPVPGPKP